MNGSAKDNGHRLRESDRTRAAKLADNVWFILASRGSMVVSAGAIAVASFFGYRFFTTFDQTVETVSRTATAILVLESRLTDHERQLLSTSEDFKEVNKRIDRIIRNGRRTERNTEQ